MIFNNSARNLNNQNYLSKSDNDINIEKTENTEKSEFKETEKLLELTRKIDIAEINKLIEDPGIKLNKNELNNIKNEIKKIEDPGNNNQMELTKKEKEFLDYTIRLDLNEIRKQIDSHIK